MKLNQNKIDQKELEFLRLNLLYSSKCQKMDLKKVIKLELQNIEECILIKEKIK